MLVIFIGAIMYLLLYDLHTVPLKLFFTSVK